MVSKPAASFFPPVTQKKGWDRPANNAIKGYLAKINNLRVPDGWPPRGPFHLPLANNYLTPDPYAVPLTVRTGQAAWPMTHAASDDLVAEGNATLVANHPRLALPGLAGEGACRAVVKLVRMCG